jgi:hypothetical protein
MSSRPHVRSGGPLSHAVEPMVRIKTVEHPPDLSDVDAGHRHNAVRAL